MFVQVDTKLYEYFTHESYHAINGIGFYSPGLKYNLLKQPLTS